MKDLSSALHDNAEIRNLIGQQIYNDYRNYQMARDELKMEKSTIDKDPRYAMSLEKNDWSRLEVAIQASDQAERARNNLVTDLRAIYSINIQVGMEELIAILRSLDKSGEASLASVQKVDEECKRTKSELDTLLKEEKLVRDYLEKNVPNGWLGVYVALAWANVTHRTLRVWRSKR